MKHKILILLLLGFGFAACESSELEDPSTQIGFSIPKKSFVKLTVINSYDVVVATLIDGEKDSGSYSVPFSMTDLAEGYYFYVLEVTEVSSGKYTKSIRKLILLK